MKAHRGGLGRIFACGLLALLPLFLSSCGNIFSTFEDYSSQVAEKPGGNGSGGGSGGGGGNSSGVNIDINIIW